MEKFNELSELIEGGNLYDDYLLSVIYEAINEYRDNIIKILTNEDNVYEEASGISDLGNGCYNILDKYICFPDDESTYEVKEVKTNGEYIVESFDDRKTYAFSGNRIREV